MYLNKYACSSCSATMWVLGDPLQCQRCGGVMVMTEQGTEVPNTTSRYEIRGEEIVFDWDEFNIWWGEING